MAVTIRKTDSGEPMTNTPDPITEAVQQAVAEVIWEYEEDGYCIGDEYVTGSFLDEVVEAAIQAYKAKMRDTHERVEHVTLPHDVMLALADFFMYPIGVDDDYAVRWQRGVRERHYQVLNKYGIDKEKLAREARGEQEEPRYTAVDTEDPATNYVRDGDGNIIADFVSLTEAQTYADWKNGQKS